MPEIISGTFRIVTMEKLVPLFPLNLVIFPASSYPLRIFEERYKIMVNNAVKNNSAFGILPLIDNKPATVGTLVSVVKKTEPFSNGEFYIIVKGGDRFEVINSWDSPYGYLEALVRVYYDVNPVSSNFLVKQLEDRFKGLLNRIDFTLEENFWTSYNSNTLKSFKIAEKSGLSLEQQVQLLRLRDEDKRINYLLDHFARIEKYYSQASVIASLIANDGYLNN